MVVRLNTIHRVSGPIGIVTAVLAGLLSLAFLLFVRIHHHRLEEEAERVLPGPLDDYRKRKRGEENVRSLALHTHRQTKMSLQLPENLTDKEQAKARVYQTQDREEQIHILSNPSERKKPSTNKTSFQKIILFKETTVYE